MVEILDEGNIKLVPPSKSASKDESIETVYQSPDSQLRVINTQENVSKSTLERHELESEKREYSSSVKKKKKNIDADAQLLISSQDSKPRKTKSLPNPGDRQRQ